MFVRGRGLAKLICQLDGGERSIRALMSPVVVTGVVVVMYDENVITDRYSDRRYVWLLLLLLLGVIKVFPSFRPLLACVVRVLLFLFQPSLLLMCEMKMSSIFF